MRSKRRWQLVANAQLGIIAMSEKPIDKASFDMRRKRLMKASPVHAIDAMFAMQCGQVLAAYHGGYLRMGWHYFLHGITMAVHGAYWSGVYRLCDKIGWTRLQPIPWAPGCFERHSAKCDKMNCGDIECVHSGIPKWFRLITRMENWTP
jgi:hypothetical protein